MLANASQAQQNNHDSPIGFMGALKIPGVVEFSLCLFFSKLVNYTFLFWLPLYIKNTSLLKIS
jgi:MFS transporter, OPA family, solute carrier family 37 (glycerol-3-phosphate transporter), member 1/2